MLYRYDGYIWNGETYLLSIQCLATLIIIVWSCCSTYVILFCIDLICPIRMAEHMELLGADYCEHNVFHPGVGVTRAVSVLQHVPQFDGKVNIQLKHVGNNIGHDKFIDEEYRAKRISVFETNPVRRGLVKVAERIDRVVGDLIGREDKSLDEIETVVEENIE